MSSIRMRGGETMHCNGLFSKYEIWQMEREGTGWSVGGGWGKYNVNDNGIVFVISHIV